MPTRVQGQKRRELLLKAALELFAADGYEGATTRAIAERTGATEAILFRHFPSKHDLFLAVIREFGPRELFRHVPREGGSRRSAGEALRALVTAYLDTTWEHRNWLRVLFQEARRDPEAAEALRGQYRAVGQALEAVFREGTASGQFREDLVAAAMQVVVLAIRGFIGRSVSRPPTDWETERDRFVTNLVSVIIGGLRPAHDRREGDRRR